MSYVVGYDTFVGIAMEDNTTSPYITANDGSDGSAFAGAAPDLSGLGAAAPTIFLPLAGDESLSGNPNYQDLAQAEGHPYLNKYQSFASKVEGSLPLMVPPGLMTFLKTWLFTRTTVDSEANQLPSATVWVNIGGVTCKRFVGVKVASADFQVSDSQAMQLNLNLEGYGEHRVDPVSFSAPTWWQHAVYGGDSIAVEIPTGTAATALNSVRWTINNKLDSNTHRLWVSNYPRKMRVTDREVTGSFDGNYIAETDYATFLAGTTGSLTATLAKTIGVTTYTSAFVFPSIRYNSFGGVNARPQKDAPVNQSVDWRALGNSSTADMTWTIT